MSLPSRILWLLCIACVGLFPACRKPVPSAGEFDATLQLGASDLWVSGHSIRARQVPVSCRRGRLTFQDLVSHREIHLSSTASELNQLMDRYQARFSTRGWESALDLLRASPWVEEVRVSKTGTLGLSVGMLIVLDNAGHVKYFANQVRTLAEAQLLHVAHGGSSETLPEGPFTPKDVVLREVASAERSR